MHRLMTVSFMLALAVPTWAQDGSSSPPNSNRNEIAQQDAITGKMFIAFHTRQHEADGSQGLRPGSPPPGVRDAYFFTLNVLNRVEFDGKIARQPNLYTQKGQRIQPALFDFEKLDINVLNPRDTSQKRTVGRWTGIVPIDTNTGAYKLAGAGDRPLRFFIEPIGRAVSINESFDGVIYGKTDDKTNLQGQTYKRQTGKDTFVEYTAKKIDPLRFENVSLATGPVHAYPRTIVNGRLDYDYETGNYLTEGITFQYTLEGKNMTDTVTGTIKWTDPKGTEKGFYEFNLRFNEAQVLAASGQGVDAVFAQGEGLEAFFSVNENVPSLTGRIVYTDKNVDNVTIESALQYNLHTHKMTEQQLMNFIKLWILIVGPTNDE